MAGADPRRFWTRGGDHFDRLFETTVASLGPNPDPAVLWAALSYGRIKIATMQDVIESRPSK